MLRVSLWEREREKWAAEKTETHTICRCSYTALQLRVPRACWAWCHGSDGNSARRERQLYVWWVQSADRGKGGRWVRGCDSSGGASSRRLAKRPTHHGHWHLYAVEEGKNKSQKHSGERMQLQHAHEQKGIKVSAWEQLFRLDGHMENRMEMRQKGTECLTTEELEHSMYM